jgi:DNA-binding transcriptional LysR family regulator
MDRFEGMRILAAVAAHGSLSAAGRALHMPLTSVSRKVSDLEARLGARLVNRTTRKLGFTEAGQAYLDAALRILEQVDEAERQARGEFVTPKGTLVMTAPVMFGRLHVLPLLADFLSANPSIDVKLILNDRNIDLMENHVDMAVRIGALPDSTMVATRVGQVSMVTCASPELLRRYPAPLSPGDLARLPCIALDTPMPEHAWAFHDPNRHRAVEVRVVPRLTVTTTDAALDAAVRGMGLCRLLEYQAAEAVRREELVLVLREFEQPAVPISLLHASGERMPLKMRSFLDFAGPRLRHELRAFGKVEGLEIDG